MHQSAVRASLITCFGVALWIGALSTVHGSGPGRALALTLAPAKSPAPGSAQAPAPGTLRLASLAQGKPAPSAPVAAANSAPSADHFEAKIRPLLAANCYACHAESAMAGLRVDSREALIRGGETGPALIPGKPEDSALIKAIQHAEGFPKMPRGRAKLQQADIDLLTEWVRGGAVWPASGTAAPAPMASHEKPVTDAHRAYWAFQPIVKSMVPAVRDASWAKNDIDRFVLARLDRDGLKPVKGADKLTLLRRASLDLTGLPPTPEEVDAFLADHSPDAFAKVVDRLLASPRYGEAWGRMWLDVARYGEDDYRSLDPMGRGLNPYPNAHLYRDWVIRAFNEDLPYAQFVQAQLAADLLEPSTRVRQLPALGFLGLGPWYYDNGAVEITRADERHDRVDAVSRGFLGMTVGCARCHDHKYDPIPTKDYYALAGVFLNAEYHEYPLAPKAIVDDYKATEKQLKRKNELLSEFMGTESRQLAETLAFQSSKYMQAAWQVKGELKRDRMRVINTEKIDYELFDRWLTFLDKRPVFYPYLKDWQAMIAKGGTAKEAEKLADDFQKLLLDIVIEQREVKKENDIIAARALPTAKPREPANLPNEFKTNDDFCPGCGLELRSMTVERSALFNDVFRQNLEPDDAPGKPARPGLLQFNGWGLEQRLGGDRRALIDVLRKDIETMEKAMPTKYAYVHGVRDVEKPGNLQVHLRGNPHRLGDPVTRGFLTVLSPTERKPLTTGSGRLDLANTIVEQPIAIRVIVNRVWKEHFGTGLVNTPSNFGINGDKPSHPELLDYLAQYFVDHGMSIKALHREIMASATYQLSADHDAAALAKDGGNRLYWRANRKRMTAEQIRDSILFVSGALDTKLGGPSVALSPLTDRRTVYGKVSRYKLDEFMQLFDFPSPSQSSEQRFATNVPLQRLFFMNSDFMQQHAERLAEKVADETDDAARIEKAYKMILGRAPTAAEVKIGRDFLQAEAIKQYQERRADVAKAEKEKAEKDKAGTASSAPASDTSAGADEPMPGMMSGVTPGAKPGPATEKMLPVTTFGRYLKILLSSNEFIFVS
ncbi:MAG TPA: PSD1 and planctomycete cytochrome C domain-containing protein [Vicinamibacterales bacterium]|nr:PSD1 and planctomycete cytochrome C domain-containing protein [Vicinamibacterales bacterium]